MLTRLKWKNKNDATAVVEVFRSLTTINTANPGTPLATLAGTATEYEDTTGVVGTTYYYAVACSKNSQRVWTAVKTFTNAKRRGPGSNDILYGDERLGYYGKVANLEMPDIAKALGFTADQALIYKFTWHKFIRKGKIIYMTDRPFSTAQAQANVALRYWSQDLRRGVGLISGMQWGFDMTAWPDAGKTLVVTRESDQFHTRLLKSLPDNWNGTTPTQAMVDDPTTEFNEIMQPLLQVFMANKLGVVWSGPFADTLSYCSFMAAEMFGGKFLARTMGAAGFYNYPSSYARNKLDFLKFVLRDSTTSTAAGYSGANYDAIWPAFELIE